MKDKLLLVSCCAPCSVAVIQDLKTQDIDFTVLFYNPNIQPKEEYIRRLEENKKV
jgi:predicted adenine nucleotide alpha hydrolase (AANH) superfamily ATPase